MTLHDAVRAVHAITLPGYWPRVRLAVDCDHATETLRIKIVARPFDVRMAAQLADELDKAHTRGAPGIVFTPTLPISNISHQRVRVETTTILLTSRPLHFDELAMFSEQRFVAWIGSAVKEFAEHEVEEFFRYKGRRVWNPHPEVPGYQDT